MKAYRLHRRVHHDLQAIATWFENERSGVGQRFLDAYESALKRLCENPRAYEEEESGVRFCPIRKFKRHYIVFVDLPTYVHVVTVTDLTRNWEHWQRRLDPSS